MSAGAEDRQAHLPGLEPDRDGSWPIRMAWLRLVQETLPKAAANRGWPVTEDHCFARILLDAAVGEPWRRRIRPPAWRNAPVAVLKEALALGEEAASGARDLHELNARSLALRGKRSHSRQGRAR